jgi:glycosyltransferase involved in cell wall biosynthesis
MKLTVVIPIYDEFQSLEILVKWVEETSNSNLKFLIVDNGSTDARVFELLAKGGPNWGGVRTPANLGFGGGILFGISRTQTDYIGWMPGNLKIDPRDIPLLLDGVVLSGNELVKAKRIGRSKSAQLKTEFLGLAQTLLLRTKMFDAGGTPTVCSKSFILSLPTPPSDYAFESFVLFMAQRAKMRIIRPKIRYTVRKFGESHWQAGLSSEIKLFLRIIELSKKWR